MTASEMLLLGQHRRTVRASSSAPAATTPAETFERQSVVGSEASSACYNHPPILGKVAEKIIPAFSISTGDQFEWQPGNIQAGFYFLVIQTKDEIHTERIVKIVG